MQYRRPCEVRRYAASGHKRLRRLAAFLEDLPAGRLSFASWRTCAVGLATSNVWFQAQGLALEHDDCVNECRPAYDGRTDWMAVSKFFEIGVGDARRLLDPSGYGCALRPHPRTVAAKIRRYLATASVAA